VDSEAKRPGDGAERMAGGLHDGDLVSFLIRQLRTGWHGDTPEGPEQPNRCQIGRGRCASRRNSGGLDFACACLSPS
jgi:hypothetical protein